MAQLSIEELEELILTRDSYRHECEKVNREITKLTIEVGKQLAAKDAEIARLNKDNDAAWAAAYSWQQHAKDRETDSLRALAHAEVLQAEIARLTALPKEGPTGLQIRDVYEAAKARDSWTDFLEWWDVRFPVSPPQPAQEQADEHPAKKGWVNVAVAGLDWLPDDPGLPAWHPANSKWAAQEWQRVAAAYDRYMAQQEGGQAQ